MDKPEKFLSKINFIKVLQQLKHIKGYKKQWQHLIGISSNFIRHYFEKITFSFFLKKKKKNKFKL